MMDVCPLDTLLVVTKHSRYILQYLVALIV